MMPHASDRWTGRLAADARNRPTPSHLDRKRNRAERPSVSSFRRAIARLGQERASLSPLERPPHFLCAALAPSSPASGSPAASAASCGCAPSSPARAPVSRASHARGSESHHPAKWRLGRRRRPAWGIIAQERAVPRRPFLGESPNERGCPKERLAESALRPPAASRPDGAVAQRLPGEAAGRAESREHLSQVRRGPQKVYAV